MPKKKDNENITKENITIEEGLLRLDDILENMEEPDIELENSFALFEEGMKLLKTVNEQIDAVEKKVMIISEDGELKDFVEDDV